MNQGLAEQSHSSNRHGYESVCAKVKAFKMIHQCHHVNAFAHRARVPQRLKPRSQSCCRRFASLPRSGLGRRPLELLKNLMQDDLLVSAHRQAESPLMRPPLSSASRLPQRWCSWAFRISERAILVQRRYKLGFDGSLHQDRTYERGIMRLHLRDNLASCRCRASINKSQSSDRQPPGWRATPFQDELPMCHCASRASDHHTTLRLRDFRLH